MDHTPKKEYQLLFKLDAQGKTSWVTRVRIVWMYEFQSGIVKARHRKP